VNIRRWPVGGRSDRPILLSLLFWADLVMVIGTHLRYPGRAIAGLVPLVLLLGLAVVLWPAPPWR
jgi:hypothetical protein